MDSREAVNDKRASNGFDTQELGGAMRAIYVGLFLWAVGFATGYINRMNNDRNTKITPSEPQMNNICINANSELDYYTSKEVFCKNGASFKRGDL